MIIKKILLFVFALAISAGYVLAADLNDYKLEIKDFTSLKVNDPINIEYYCSEDSAGFAYFTCSSKVASMLMFTNNKSNLLISLSDDYASDMSIPTVRVYSSKLFKVENGSDSTIYVASNVCVDSFKARVIGNGSIVIDNIDANSTDLSLMTGHGHIAVSSGKVNKAKYSNVGTGTIEASDVKAEEVKVTVFGTGGIDCDVSEKLIIYGTGTGIVNYSGNPKKISNRSVGVKAYPAASE